MYAHQFVDLTGETLTNVSLFEAHLSNLLCDLIGLAMNKYNKVCVCTSSRLLPYTPPINTLQTAALQHHTTAAAPVELSSNLEGLTSVTYVCVTMFIK